MEIHSIEFEKPFTLLIQNQTIQVTIFVTDEHGNVKFGIDAPRGVAVNREEIHFAKLEKLKMMDSK